MSIQQFINKKALQWVQKKEPRAVIVNEMEEEIKVLYDWHLDKEVYIYFTYAHPSGNVKSFIIYEGSLESFIEELDNSYED